jgi:hypothetical protein
MLPSFPNLFNIPNRRRACDANSSQQPTRKKARCSESHPSQPRTKPQKVYQIRDPQRAIFVSNINPSYEDVDSIRTELRGAFDEDLEIENIIIFVGSQELLHCADESESEYRACIEFKETWMAYRVNSSYFANGRVVRQLSSVILNGQILNIMPWDEYYSGSSLKGLPRPNVITAYTTHAVHLTDVPDDFTETEIVTRFAAVLQGDRAPLGYNPSINKVKIQHCRVLREIGEAYVEFNSPDFVEPMSRGGEIVLIVSITINGKDYTRQETVGVKPWNPNKLVRTFFEPPQNNTTHPTQVPTSNNAAQFSRKSNNATQFTTKSNNATQFTTKSNDDFHGSPVPEINVSKPNDSGAFDDDITCASTSTFNTAYEDSQKDEVNELNVMIGVMKLEQTEQEFRESQTEQDDEHDIHKALALSLQRDSGNL